MLLRNLFGGGKQAPPPGMAFHPRVARGDPMSMRVFLNEQPTMVVDDLDAVSTAPVWQQTDFSLPLPVERSHVISYQPSKVRPVAGSGAVNIATMCCSSCADVPSAGLQRHTAMHATSVRGWSASHHGQLH